LPRSFRGASATIARAAWMNCPCRTHRPAMQAVWRRSAPALRRSAGARRGNSLPPPRRNNQDRPRSNSVRGAASVRRCACRSARRLQIGELLYRPRLHRRVGKAGDGRCGGLPGAGIGRGDDERRCFDPVRRDRARLFVVALRQRDRRQVVTGNTGVPVLSPGRMNIALMAISAVAQRFPARPAV